MSQSHPPRSVLATSVAALLALLAVPAGAATYQYGTTSGTTSFNTAGNWTPNWTVFTNASDVANVTGNITATANVDLASDTTVGIINVGDSNTTHAYALRTGSVTPTAKFIFDNGASNAQLNQTATSFGDTLSALYTIGGTGILDISNASTTKSLTISSNSVATGTINLLAGTIVAGNANAFGTTTLNLGAASSAANATLQGNGSTVANPINLVTTNIGTLTVGTSGSASSVFSGGVVLNSHALNLDGGTGTGSVSVGAISGTANVNTNTGASGAVVTLSGVNTFTGTLNIGGTGTTNVNGLNSTNVGAINVNGGTLNVGTSSVTAVDNALGTNASNVVTLGAATTLKYTANGNKTIGGAGYVIGAGNTATLQNAGGNGRIVGLGTLSSSLTTLAPWTVGSGSTLNWVSTSGSASTGFIGTVTIPTTFTINATGLAGSTGILTLGAKASTTVVGGGSSIASDQAGITGSGTLTISAGSATTAVPVALAPVNNSGFSGTITVNSNGVLRLGQLNSLGTNVGTLLTVASGAGLDLNVTGALSATANAQIVQNSGSIERWSADGARGSTTTAYTVPAGITLQIFSNQSGGRTITMSSGSALQMWAGAGNVSGQNTFKQMSGAMTVSLAGAVNVGESGTQTGIVDQKPGDTVSIVLNTFTVPTTSAYFNKNTLEILSTLSGAGSLTKVGADTAVIRNPTYAGGTTVNGGILGIGAATTGINLLTVGAAGTFDLSNNYAYGNGQNTSATFTTARNSFNVTVAGISGSGVITDTGAKAATPTDANRNTTSTTTNTLTTSFASGIGTQTFSGQLRDGQFVVTGRVGDGTVNNVATSTSNGILAFTKAGTGTQILSGPNNTYTGATIVTGGVLEVSGSINGSSSVSVTAGSLLLSGSTNGAIKDSASVTLDNATFRVSGTSSEFVGLDSATATAAGLGALILGSTSTIDFGAGASTLWFANIGSLTGTLNIDNWSGDGTNGGGTDQLRFTSDPIAFLSQINFTGIGGASEIFFNNGGNSYYEIVAVPEPSSTALIGAAALLGLVGFRERRRFVRNSSR